MPNPSDDTRRVFDVSHPARNTPSPTSRNIIVNNQTAPDSSVKRVEINAAAPPAPTPPPEPVSTPEPAPVAAPEPQPGPVPPEQANPGQPKTDTPEPPADTPQVNLQELVGPSQEPQSSSPMVIPAAHPVENVKHLYGWRKFLLVLAIFLVVAAAVAFILGFFE